MESPVLDRSGRWTDAEPDAGPVQRPEKGVDLDRGPGSRPVGPRNLWTRSDQQCNDLRLQQQGTL
jgi:hypothetical protein